MIAWTDRIDLRSSVVQSSLRPSSFVVVDSSDTDRGGLHVTKLLKWPTASVGQMQQKVGQIHSYVHHSEHKFRK